MNGSWLEVWLLGYDENEQPTTEYQIGEDMTNVILAMEVAKKIQTFEQACELDGEFQKSAYVQVVVEVVEEDEDEFEGTTCTDRCYEVTLRKEG